MSRLRDPLLLALVGLLVHATWALTIRAPVDWDPSYYALVAHRIAEGSGPTIPAIFSLVLLPERLPMPADLHWMPLPSRILVPATWLWPAGGAQLTTVLLAALWAPLCWALARAMGAPRGLALLAGLLTVAAGPYSRFLSTPDSIALYGVIGSFGLLSVARGRAGLAGVAAVLAALCRGDGFLLGPCLALGLRGRARLLPLLLGPLASAAWMIRCGLLAGPDWLAARGATSSAASLGAFLLGDPPPLGLLDRVGLLLDGLPVLLRLALLLGGFLLPPFALLAAWRFRTRPLVRASASYALVMPVVAMLAAPGVAASGTPFRSAAALFPLSVALAVLGLDAASAHLARAREMPRHLLTALVAGGFAVVSVGMGIGTWRARPDSRVDCAALADLPQDATIFAADPLAVAERCNRPAVVLPKGLDPARADQIARRYQITAALPAPNSSGADLQGARQILPTWRQSGPLLIRPAPLDLENPVLESPEM